MKKIVIGMSLVMGCTIVSCSSKPGDPDTERHFQGKWRTEYYLGNKDMRMLVKEEAEFDTLTHRYTIHQQQDLIYPVNINYANVYYEGTWKADTSFLYGDIDGSTVVNELNPQFGEEEEFRVYLNFIKNEADADMERDRFLIRNLSDDRIHLFDDDRDVAHDLIRVDPVAAEDELDVAI